MNLQRLSINTGRKSIISFFDILHKRSQSTAVTTYKSHDNRQSMHITGFQLLSHKSYYPFMIESITHQLDLLDKFVLVIEQITDARQLYSTTLKNICQSLTENVENTESIKNDNNINDNNEVLFDLWRTFVEKAHNEAELHDNTVQQTKEKVVNPLKWIVKNRRQQISRLKAFRTSTDSTLKECSEKVIELQSNYAEMYRIYREVIQTKTIKDLLNAHNSYVLQLHMTNTMKAYYHNLILPQLMQEFETIVRENTTEFIQIFDYFCSIHANMFDQLICNNNGVQIKMKEITPDAIVSIIVQNLNKNKNPTHWHLMEYLPPDGDCPEILCSDHVIIDNLVKIELQCKFNELKRQFAELSSFMQQNVNIVDTLKSLEKRYNFDTQVGYTHLNMHDDIYRKEDEIRKARIALAGIEVQISAPLQCR
ncbi:tyrosine- kinase Fes Fps-like isoform X5 [Schistosoma japonicum]|uniref:Tyrosine-kinase Fes Fps-like isoform X5 n=1 Tax=Schistosoma japonicum TaxID=6182 RepID=A0A4Z2DES4_SCHJA|nr:tyrosine- kinase Fes Fps-like isoform X5 [Schistosoma japonicum]